MPENIETLHVHVEKQLSMAQNLFGLLQNQTSDQNGITRVAYGSGEQVAHDLVARAARGLNLETHVDDARNLYITLPGRNRSAPCILTGSHLDSVPQGGNYDGAAGVIAGLMALAAIRDAGLNPKCDISVIGIRAEESAWFPQEHVGSRAALGLLARNELEAVRRTDSGRTLGEHMAEAGCNIDAIQAGVTALSHERVRSFIELHIEQGPVLVQQNTPVGIVTGIRGNFRARHARCVGEYGHAGAVPRAMRQDAVMATAAFIHQLETLWRELENEGEDLVLTVGVLATDSSAHAISKVPGDVRFTLEARSQSSTILEEFRHHTLRIATAIGHKRGVILDLGNLVQLEPATMDPSLRSLLAKGCDTIGLQAMELPSGSGHDAAEFARAGIPAAMIFIRNPQGSHNPKEHMAPEDFIQGVKLLAWSIATLSLSEYP